MTRRTLSGGAADEASTDLVATRSRPPFAASTRTRWLSPRALLLHLEVVVVATGCLAAGWWQLTSALAGNGLSWVYTVEWPIFAVVAIGAWWLLIHEDPEAYRARKQRPRNVGEAAPATNALATATHENEITFDRRSARVATVLAVVVGIDLALGILTLIFVPTGRPTGWVPATWAPLYLAHAILGLLLALGAADLLARVRRAARISRLSGWIGAVGVAIASAGGLLAVAHPLRVAGMICMMVGALVAGFAYLFPTFEKMSRTSDR